MYIDSYYFSLMRCLLAAFLIHTEILNVKLSLRLKMEQING